MNPPSDHPTHGTSPGESTNNSRQPTQLAVLLAGAGSPPLDAEQTRVAPIRLHDAFVLAPDRAALFRGGLFRDAAAPTDPRHDALARILRALAVAMRARLDVFDAGAGSTSELLRGMTALVPWRIESVLSGWDARAARPTTLDIDVMLGSPAAEVDPLDAPDAGVVRRLIALATRGLMADRGNPRGGGVVSDLGGVTLVLGLLDLAANPRSALRAVRARLVRAGRLAQDGTARARDAGHALRELLSQAVSSSTTTGAAGRDLIKEATLPPELFDEFVVALARAVYDGLAPDDEHPLVVAGVAPAEAFSAAPLLAAANDDDALGDAVAGLYNRIAFAPLRFAPEPPPDVAQSSGPGVALPPPVPPPSRPPRGAALDEGTFTRVRDALTARSTADAMRAALSRVASVLDATVDPNEALFTWRRATPAATAAAITRATHELSPATQIVVLVGARADAGREALDALAGSLAADAEWSFFAPRATDRALTFETLEPGLPGAQLRRADLSRWLPAGGDAPRAVQWDLAPGTRVLLNAAALDAATPASLDALCALCADAADKLEPRGLVVLVGAASWADAARTLDALARRPVLESGPAPVRPGTVWFVRSDAPFRTRNVPGSGRTHDEAVLSQLADAFAPGASSVADLAARAMLLPADGRYRARLVQLAALGHATVSARRGVERAAREPASGNAARRALQLGHGAQTTVRAAIAAGQGALLLACARTEVALRLAEWDGPGPRAPSARLADVARGLLMDAVLAAHPRALVLASEGLIASLGAWSRGDFVERATTFDAAHAVALGVRAAGTVYEGATRPREAVPLGFVLRGGSADLFALCEPVATPTAPRTLPTPWVELVYRPSSDEASLGSVATVLKALADSGRRPGPDSPLRLVPQGARSSFSALCEVVVDARMVPESVRLAVPLRAGATETDVQRLATEVTSRALDTGTGQLHEWTAQAQLEGRGLVPLPLTGPMILREFVARWTRALRSLPRYFPGPSGTNARYARVPAIQTAAELGQVTAVLNDRGIPSSSPGGRAVLARMGQAAQEVLPRVRELAVTLPLRGAPQDDPSEHEAVERVLAIAWFLHVNFCTTVPGGLQWTPEGGSSVERAVEEWLDRNAVRTWLQRKSSRPAVVDERVRALYAWLEPSVVVE